MVAAGFERFVTMTVHGPARCAGSRGNGNRQVSRLRLVLQKARFLESMTESDSPYHVRMWTFKSTDAGVTIRTSKVFVTGARAVIL